MKKTLPVLLLCFCLVKLHSQTHVAPDTILIQNFTVDPSDTMLDFPNGNDLHWVNWDAHNLATACGNVGVVIPGNWFWESDFGDLNDPPVNSAFTSCSYLIGNQPNENWLISPQVYIPDSSTYLSWRSLSIEGPGYLDGYKVLVSISSNEPFIGAFTDTLFVAAEMLSFSVPESLDPDDYVFSPGYIHANRYTDTAYFFLDPEYPFGYSGKLEPHQVNLAKYIGKNIYVAFLHDSTNDNLLQIDDISIIQGLISPAWGPEQQEYFLHIQPNPTAESTTLSWKFQTRQEGRLIVRNLLGQTLHVQPIEDMSIGTLQLNTHTFPAGTYPCSLQTALGQQTILLVKR